MKLLNTAIAALALCLTGLQVSAAPIAFADVLPQKQTFTRYVHFHVDFGQQFVGQFETASEEANDVVIEHLLLTGPGNFSFGNPVQSVREIDGWDMNVERWSLPSSFLAAGDWTLEIKGEDKLRKAGGQYEFSLTGVSNRVPEPASLGLATGAIAAMLLVSRRRKSQ
ncbi:PEP-CTERM sorting domain-containing protein [Paucibacter soli]|uniref:PEP-CTERM sorting domain-containing protein n=1 Tax=Paucibacter soli TaxID=3133433 RepID=UPI0030AE750B